jgi:hypothetical protein
LNKVSPGLDAVTYNWPNKDYYYSYNNNEWSYVTTRPYTTCDANSVGKSYYSIEPYYAATY